ncbi:MAG: ribonuclease HI, partial [Bdellovibrio sp.]|nr:ribonuclease HI [Bdellovibrio sp.]
MQHLKRNHIHVFVDGACKGNPGPGGWGVILILPDVYVKETGGHQKTATNNQMELT